MVRDLRSTCAVLLLWFAVSADGFAQTFSGPIELSNQYPLHNLHLSWTPQRADVLDEGRKTVRLGAACANTALLREFYTVDSENCESRISLSYAPLERLELGAEAALLGRGGGIADGGIDAWHRFFHLQRGDRDVLEDSAYDVSGSNGQGSAFDLSRSGVGLGNAVLKAKYLLIADARENSALSMDFRLGLPTASGSFGHDGLDFLAGLAGHQRFGTFRAYGGIAQLIYSSPEESGIEFRRTHSEGFVALEYAGFSAVSLYAGVFGGVGVLKNLEGHPGFFLYLDTGIRVPLDASTELELLVRENPDAGDGSTDIALLAALSREF